MRKQGATSRGLFAAQVPATVDAFFKRYPGADNVKIEIHQSATTLPRFDAARDGCAVTTSGEYVSKTDTVHLVSSAFESPADVTRALQEEILVHKELGFFPPEDRRQLYRDIQEAAKASKEVAAL